MDLVCLVADASIKAAVEGMLTRPQALGIRAITREIIVHPNRDPGCFHGSVGLIRGYRTVAQNAVVLLDRDWAGAPAGTAESLEQTLEATFPQHGLHHWARAVVIDPELEAWVFSESPHVPEVLGWQGRDPPLRSALEAEQLWPAGIPKPPDPKAALEWALRQAAKPRSASIYREIAKLVSLVHCEDRAFKRLRALLQVWFPPKQ